MDLTPRPGSRTERLPRPLQPPAMLVVHALEAARRARERRALRKAAEAAQPAQPAYVFESDGFATVHFSPFIDDPDWNARYRELRREWWPEAEVDLRWRLWLMTAVAQQCSALEGNYAEFGVYRAGCAFMIFSTGAFGGPRRFFLFDTFAGIPADRLAPEEVDFGLAGAHSDTSIEYVRRRLQPWEDHIVIVAGDVNETLRDADTGPLAFVHMDLNAAEPTRVALEYAYPRLVSGAMIVFDDYGQRGLEPQRAVVDEFFAASEMGERVIAVPTGQGLLVKR